MFVTGPEVVKTVTNEVVTQEELGGAVTHTTKSGVADVAFENDIDALLATREFFDFLPLSATATICPSGRARTRSTASRTASTRSIPPSAATPYDMHELIRKVADEGDFFELQPAHAANIIIGFCRIEGRTVGVVANQPMVLAGVLDINIVEEGRALRPLLRRVRHPDPDLRRRARLPPRRRRRSITGSSSTARNCCSLMPRRRCPRSR